MQAPAHARSLSSIAQQSASSLTPSDPHTHTADPPSQCGADMSPHSKSRLVKPYPVLHTHPAILPRRRALITPALLVDTDANRAATTGSPITCHRLRCSSNTGVTAWRSGCTSCNWVFQIQRHTYTGFISLISAALIKGHHHTPYIKDGQSHRHATH